MSKLIITNILSYFPNIKLSYENITHNKVHRSDYIVAIPEGTKCFIWFTFYNHQKVCFLMELNDIKQIINIHNIHVDCSNDLFKGRGTIFYGTNFYLEKEFFSIEDIFYYKGIECKNLCWGEKLVKINTLFKNDLNKTSFFDKKELTKTIYFGLPFMSKTNEDLENKIKNSQYKIASIQFKLFSKVNNFLFMDYNNYVNDNKKRQTNVLNNNTKNNNTKNNNTKNNNTNTNTNIHKKYIKETVFLVRPDIQDDIYFLYFLNNELKEEQHSIAHIPDYKTSVMMNSIFRNIKENTNLDLLEESDDEEEFEDDRIDKFVHLNKSYKMVCQFNNKFKKWIPLRVANENA